ncbi:MAG: alpha/beta hydrolase-fold protein [Gemmatimonadota bacterium]|nr:alpha/beta hydrolase-fold protein [Gemmatimonadota bacterium]
MSIRSAAALAAAASLWASSLSAQTAPKILPSPLSFGQTFVLHSTVLGEDRRINIYLPPVYSDSPAVRLPVLYMPDGGMAEDFLHVAGLVQVSVGNGTMRPFILVGIENTQRRRDLTGQTTNPKDSAIAPRVGGSADFRRFIRTELMPAVNAAYRTTGETAIIGESLAGLFIVETFLLEPDLFDSYVAFDPSLWWNHAELVKTAAARIRSIGAKPKSVYLAASRDDIDGFTGQLAILLDQNAPKTLKWFYDPMPEESHATIYDPASIRAVRRLFKPD